MTVTEKIKVWGKVQAIKLALSFMTTASNKNIARTLKLIGFFAPKHMKPQIKGATHQVKDNPMFDLLKRLYKESHPNYKKEILETLIIKNMLLYSKQRDDLLKKGNHVPFTILFSPTMRCNIRCKGCYAGNYSKKDDMSYELMDRIVKEGKEMGVAFYTILGGEPTLRIKDILKVAKKHKGTFFQMYTNATLLNEKILDEFVELGNIVPIFSIEGTEAETTARRGKGVYQHIMKAMDLCKKKRIPFGYSIVPSRMNVDTAIGDKFVDQMIEKGAFIGWYFMYMPIGHKPDPDYMLTPEQRKKMLNRSQEIRATKPLFMVDFWNDAPYVGGCIAAKQYVHITSKGDVEPCIFTHWAVDNIKDKSLVEVMNSDYFKALRAAQPYSDNLLLPCQLVDHPEVMRHMHKKFKPYPTHPGAETLVKDKKLKAEIDKYSKTINKFYASIWKKFKKEHPKIQHVKNPPKRKLDIPKK